MDFDNLIIDLVRKANPDLDSRLESQAEALDELECTNPVLGKWIDEYDYEYLLAAFNLNDGEFSRNFPGMAHLNQHDRSQIIEAFEDHFDHCAHCYLKRGYDLEMNDKIERVYTTDKTLVAQYLQELAPQEPRVSAKVQGSFSALTELNPPLSTKTAASANGEGNVSPPNSRRKYHAG
jgi:DNA-binding transcriptional MocR family regulator